MIRTFAATAAAVIALATPIAAAIPASAAPAQRTPVMYSGGIWQNAARRPHSFTLGADFGLSHMSWSRWTNTSAFGHGHLVACAGAAGPCAIFRAGVTLRKVKTHNGTRYFASMTLTGKNRRTQKLVMRNGAWILTTSGYRTAPRH